MKRPAPSFEMLALAALVVAVAAVSAILANTFHVFLH